MNADTPHDTRILVISDDYREMEHLSGLFTQFNCQFDLAENDQESLELLETCRYDLCLLDLDLTEFDPFEMAKTIRSNYSTTFPIIAICTNTEMAKIMRCFDVKISDFYAKPITRHNLLELIHIWKHKQINQSSYNWRQHYS